MFPVVCVSLFRSWVFWEEQLHPTPGLKNQPRDKIPEPLPSPLPSLEPPAPGEGDDVEDQAASFEKAYRPAEPAIMGSDGNPLEAGRPRKAFSRSLGLSASWRFPSTPPLKRRSMSLDIHLSFRHETPQGLQTSFRLQDVFMYAASSHHLRHHRFMIIAIATIIIIVNLEQALDVRAASCSAEHFGMPSMPFRCPTGVYFHRLSPSAVTGLSCSGSQLRLLLLVLSLSISAPFARLLPVVLNGSVSTTVEYSCSLGLVRTTAMVTSRRYEN